MLHSQRIGGGPRPTLFLHGFLGAGRNMTTLARRVSELDPTRSIFLLDLPGHGRSRELVPSDDFASVASEVIDAGRSLAGERFEIVGHSLGGRVGLRALGTAPDTIESLVMLDITPSPTHELPTELIAKILLGAPERADTREALGDHLRAHGLSGALTDWLLTNAERDEVHGGFRWKIDRQALLEFHLRTSPTDLWSIAERHAPKIRAVAGGASPYTSDVDQDRLRALGIPVRVIPGAGHFLHADAPEAVARAITEP